MRKQNFFFLALASCFLILIGSCGSDDEGYTPKPRGYYRIDFPEKNYVTFDSVCPFAFNYPSYAKIVPDKKPNAEPCWVNLEFPKFKSVIHLTYRPVNNNIAGFLEESRTLAVKHTVKATGIDEQLILRDSAKVYGLVYDITGNAASSLQFYLTDSTKHFIRGALYFNVAPNDDSLRVVVDFLRKDVDEMIRTFRWK